jgi:hypothetical protein
MFPQRAILSEGMVWSGDDARIHGITDSVDFVPGEMGGCGLDVFSDYGLPDFGEHERAVGEKVHGSPESKVESREPKETGGGSRGTRPTLHSLGGFHITMERLMVEEAWREPRPPL